LPVGLPSIEEVLKVFGAALTVWAKKMTKGKPRDINEVPPLKHLVEEDKGFEELSKIMVKTDDAIRQKVFDLGLKVKNLKEKK
jgi:hypothetical protein